jgi:hypothetical protein
LEASVGTGASTTGVVATGVVATGAVASGDDATGVEASGVALVVESEAWPQATRLAKRANDNKRIDTSVWNEILVGNLGRVRAQYD